MSTFQALKGTTCRIFGISVLSGSTSYSSRRSQSIQQDDAAGPDNTRAREKLQLLD